MSIDIVKTNTTVDVSQVIDNTTVQATGIAGPAGEGVPAGGTTNQVLKKASNADYDTNWQDEAAGSGTVTSVSATGNDGITASVATETTTPAITLGLSDGGVAIGKINGLQTALNAKYDASNPSGYISASGAPVQSVAGRTGTVTLAKADVGLVNVDNTSDANKPVSSATQSALDLKANTASLATVATTGDYGDLINKPTIPANTDQLAEGATNLYMTAAEQSKLAGIQSGAEVNVNADWNATSGDAQILNKPTIPTVITDHTGLTSIGTNSHAQIDSHIANTSNPHSVTATQVGLGNVNNTSDLNKPISTATQAALDAKQATLVSGTSIKTINSTSLLGSGNIAIGGFTPSSMKAVGLSTGDPTAGDVDMTWTIPSEPVGWIDSDYTLAANIIDITINTTGRYAISFTTAVDYNNRIELMAIMFLDTGSGFVELATEKAANYAARDANQNNGSVTLDTAYVFSDGDVIKFISRATKDGTGTPALVADRCRVVIQRIS